MSKNKDRLQLIIEVSPAEKARLEAYAKAEDLRMAQVIRRLIRGLPDPSCQVEGMKSV